MNNNIWTISKLSLAKNEKENYKRAMVPIYNTAYCETFSFCGLDIFIVFFLLFLFVVFFLASAG